MKIYLVSVQHPCGKKVICSSKWDHHYDCQYEVFYTCEAALEVMRELSAKNAGRGLIYAVHQFEV